MTVFAKNITYGLETAVKEIQQYLDDNLLWNDKTTEADKLEVYGLIIKNTKKDLIIPEAYLGLGINKKEYGEAFVNDKIFASIGFVETGERILGTNKSSNIDIIVTMRLDKIYENQDYEKALFQFETCVNGFYGRNEILEAKLGINDVFSGFDVDRIKNRDMYPWFVFSMNLNIRYYNNNKCL